MNAKAYWANMQAQRKRMPQADVLRLAAQQIERRLVWGKSGERKPRLRVFDKPRGGIRFVLYAGRYFIRATTWERVIYRAAFGPWTKTPPQVTRQQKAKRPPCRKTTATIRHGGEGSTAMLLVGVKRDELGRVLSGWVDNGAWQLAADHEEQVFWSEEYPNRKTSMANFKGWDK